MLIDGIHENLLGHIALGDNKLIKEYLAVLQTSQATENRQQDIDHTTSLDTEVTELGVHEFDRQRALDRPEHDNSERYSVLICQIVLNNDAFGCIDERTYFIYFLLVCFIPF